MAAALSKEENKAKKMEHRNIVLQRGHHGFPCVLSILLTTFITSVLAIIMAALYMKAFLPTFKYYGTLGQEKQNKRELKLFVLFKVYQTQAFSDLIRSPLMGDHKRKRCIQGCTELKICLAKHFRVDQCCGTRIGL